MLKLGHIHYQHNDMSKSGNNILRMYVCMEVLVGVDGITGVEIQICLTEDP